MSGSVTQPDRASKLSKTDVMDYVFEKSLSVSVRWAVVAATTT
jgi:hypothetical protein